MTIFGVAPPGGEMAEHKERYGGLPLGYPRFFFSPGKHAAWNAFPLKNRNAGDIPVISVKTWNAADFSALLTSVPANVGDWWFSINHEPEDELTSGSLKLATLLANYQQARTLIAQVPDTGCQLILILNWYQITQVKFDTAVFDSILELVDAVGVDAYALRADTKKNIYTPPGLLLGPALELSDRAGVPWAVPEFGVALAADNDGQRHAAAVWRYARWMRSHGALWASYWCNTAGEYAPHLCNTPEYREAFSTWRGLM